MPWSVTTMTRRSAVYAIVIGAVLMAPSRTGAIPGSAPTGDPEGAPQSVSPVAFINVTVVPMDLNRVLEGYTVIVRNGRIADMGPVDEVAIPADASRIDGEGRFLMPALSDMNAYLPGSTFPDSQMEDLLFLYLANGVTAIRSAAGSPHHLALKRRVDAGALLGPTIFVSGPPFLVDTTMTTDTVQSLVRTNRAMGYDFMRLHPDTPVEMWDDLTRLAHTTGVSFGGLIPEAIGLRRALANGISTVDHLDGYLEAAASEEIKERMRPVVEVDEEGVETIVEEGEEVPWEEILRSVTGRQLRAIAAHTRAANTWVTPTLYLWDLLHQPLNVDSMLALPEVRYIPPRLRGEWIQEKRRSPSLTVELAQLQATLRQDLLRALNNAGVGIVMGTGSPRMFNVPGFSLRREIPIMRDARLLPYEVLLTGTRNVGRYASEEMSEPGSFGVVSEGNRADLILLEGNPLEELDHLWDQVGVMVRGRWLPREWIEERLAAIEDKYSG